MAASINPSASTQRVLKNLRQFHTRLQIRALSATNDIVRGVHFSLIDIYGNKLGRLWYVEPSRSRAKNFLAGVSIDGNDKRIRGFEFGTRPHIILPNNAKVLRFYAASMGMYGLVYTKKVNHPGTPAHNRRNSAQIALGSIARSEWKKVFDDTIATLR